MTKRHPPIPTDTPDAIRNHINTHFETVENDRTDTGVSFHPAFGNERKLVRQLRAQGWIDGGYDMGEIQFQHPKTSLRITISTHFAEFRVHERTDGVD